jgi:HK97 gp10 family phage protein
MKLKIRMDGLKGLQKALAAAPKQVAARLDKALAKNANEMAGSARALAPVDSGALRDSIGVEHDGGTYFVEAKDEAAPHVEWGTRERPAHPFFYVAYRAQKTRFRRRNARAIRDGIKDAGLDPKGVLK